MRYLFHIHKSSCIHHLASTEQATPSINFENNPRHASNNDPTRIIKPISHQRTSNVQATNQRASAYTDG